MSFRDSGATPWLGEGADLASVAPRWWEGRDFIVTGQGDSTGYHLFIALERQKYIFKPLATIQPNGYDSDRWLGYQCVTGDRRHVVVSLLPRWGVNRAAVRDRGGLVYVVSVATGAVRPLVKGVAFKYHAVGCGAGAQVALLRHLGHGQERTELLLANAASGDVRKHATVSGQLTSPIPFGKKVLALRGREIVELAAGDSVPEPVARVRGEPFRLSGADRGADLLVLHGKDTVTAEHLEDGTLRTVGSGPAARVRLLRGAGGRNVAVGLDKLTGARDLIAARTPSLAVRDPRGHVTDTRVLVPDAVSVEGKVVVATTTPRSTREAVPHAGGPLGGGDHGEFVVEKRVFLASTGALLQGNSPRGRAPKVATGLPAAVGAVKPNDAATPVCGVSRNEPRRMAYGPSDRQVTWAVEMASRNLLSGANARPANYLSSGLPAYSPSNDFRVPALRPAGGNIPPVVMNGVLAQESAYRHASRRSLPGSGGNPSISDYYGAGGTLDVIDYSEADCGYGIAQVTSGMRLSDGSITPNGKAKVAIDYAENIHAGMNVLAKKWNQLYDAGIRLNDSNPALVENWYLALWAYNSGVQPDWRFGNTSGCTPSPSCADPHGHWGLGWTNNPMNPDYPPTRQVFLRETYADAEHPGDWPYQERVLGWAETPILNFKGQPTYQPAVAGPLGDPGFPITYPDRTSFCSASNECSPTYDPPGGLDFCMRTDRHCWWHSAITTMDCFNVCARSPFTWAANAPEPPEDNPWPADCDSDLGPNAIIVDDLNDPSANIFCPSRNWSTSGTFSYTVGTDSGGSPLGIIDFHQLATGFGAHTWFAGNRVASDTAHHVTGTWTPSSLTPGPYIVKAHIPRAGAAVGSAVYRITTVDGTVREKVINQHEHYNHWKSLGAYQLGPNAKVELSNVTRDDTQGGVGTVAWDAIAFIPAPGQYVEQAVEVVALFDEDQNLDTAFPASWLPSPLRSRQDLHDWALRLTEGILAYPGCASLPSASCVMPQVRQAMARWRQDVLAAGTDPVNHPDGTSIPTWIGFANPYTDRPTGPSKPGHFDSDPNTYKHKTKATISYVVGSDGRIVEGSADAIYEHTTGYTHLPRFLTETIGAITADYELDPPDLEYSTEDLTVHDHQVRTAHPNDDGILPGRAYAFAGKEPVVTDETSEPSTHGTCVAALYVSGGSIGYRPLLGVGYVSAEFDGWLQRLRSKAAQSTVPQEVADLAGEFYNAFFKAALATGSPFNNAPPIWQELNFRACVDGSIRPIGGSPPLLRVSHMPDQYFYHNGQAMGLDGQLSGSAAPVLRGDFYRFSRVPDLQNPFLVWANPWEPCDSDTGRSGNPWDMLSPAPAALNPSRAHFCVDRSIPTDSDYS